MNNLIRSSGITLTVAAFIALCLSGCDSGTPIANDESDYIDLAIRKVTVIDAVSGVQKDMSIFVQNDKIVSVLKSSAGQELRARKDVDGTGKYLIPGLWDAHVHLSFDDKVASSMFRLFIANGITSVRDTGGQLDLVLAAREASRKEPSPSIYIAGPLLDGEPTVYAGKASGFPKIGKTITTIEQAITEVDRLADAGVDLLKAYEMLSPEVFKAVLKRAKFHGLPVTGHVPLSMTAVQAAREGLDSMEHMRNLQMDCSNRESELFAQRKTLLLNQDNMLGSKLRSEIHAAQHFPAVQSYDAELCQKLVNQLAMYDSWQVPTMTLNQSFKTLYFSNPGWQKTYQTLPPAVASTWLERSTRFGKTLSAPSEKQAQRIQIADWQVSMLKQIVDANIPVMAGTDTPIFFLTPGFSLHLELETLVDAGMTPMQAIESATLAPAKYFDLEKAQGSVSQGMLADLVLLNADPLLDIKNTTKIHAVIKGGKLFERTQLDSLLEPK